MLTAFFARPLARIALAGALVGLLAFLWQRGNDYRAQRDTARAQVAQWKAANAAATAWAEAEKKARERAAQARKDQADAKLTLAETAARPALDRYAERNRCVRAEAAGGGGQRAALPGPAAVAPQPERAGAAAELLVGAPLIGVPRGDLDICAANTLRLENAVEWARGLAN